MYPTERAAKQRQRHGRGMVKTTTTTYSGPGRGQTSTRYQSWFEPKTPATRSRLGRSEGEGWLKFVSPWAPPPTKVVPHSPSVGAPKPGGGDKLPDDFYDPEDKQGRDWDKWAEELEELNRKKRNAEWRYDQRPNPYGKALKYMPHRRGYYVLKSTFRIGEYFTSPEVPFDPDPYGVGSAVASDGFWHPWAEMRRCSANSGAGKWQNPNVAQHWLSTHTGGGSLNCTTVYAVGAYTRNAAEGDPCSLDGGSRRVTATGKISDSYRFINFGQIDCSDPDLNPGWTQLDPDNLPGSPGRDIPLDNWPMEFPQTAPVGRPGFPQPQRWPDAIPRPGTQPRARPSPRESAANPPMTPFPVTIVQPKPGVEPKPQPQEWTFSPVPGGTKIRFAPTVRPGGKRKPFKGTKQTKNTPTVLGVPGWVIIQAGSEIVDFVDAMWMALPKDCRSKGAKHLYNRRDGKGKVWGNKPLDPFSKLKDVYRCWDHFDKNKAIANFANDQIEDIFYARLGKGAAGVYGSTGQATGVQRAINSGDDARRDAQGARGERETSMQLPTFSYDEFEGRWSLDVGGFTVYDRSQWFNPAK